jgi:hypothetical protein
MGDEDGGTSILEGSGDGDDMGDADAADEETRDAFFRIFSCARVS